MKVIFIIGNGFDINLGMKTKYSDFYTYYQTIDSKSILIKNLKESISGDFKSWSDLELALGNYTENINSLAEFDEVFEDIEDNLADYLQQDESKLDLRKIDKEKLINYICYPEKSLLKADTDNLTTYKNNWRSTEWSINMITLNYTRTIEKMFSDETKNIRIGTHHNYEINLNGVEHIHGYVDDRMVMGVNDISQIKNSNFHKNQEILEALIKTNCNKVNKHTIDDLCTQQIQSANLICIFGSSIGDTDNNWWELIGKQLKENCRLIIFTKGEEIKQRRAHLKARLEREVKELFLKKTKLSDEEKTIVSEKIYVGVNTDFFSNILQ